MDTATAPAPPVFDWLAALGDTTRGRILALLERHEMTVSELCQVLQLPQSTASRHLKVLADGGWLAYRSEGTSRHYRVARDLPDDARALWGLVGQGMAGSGFLAEDRERARSVLALRRDRSREFFARAADRWDGLRTELYGPRSELLPLLGLLDPGWVVGDLGAGTAPLSALLAPFVARVIAVDRSEEMLAAAARRLQDAANVELRQGELEALPLDDGALDLAVLSLVLHYVQDPPLALAEAGRVLRPGGRLVVVEMRAHGRDGYMEEMGHAWPGFEPGRLQAWMEEAGLVGVRHAPLAPDPEARGPLLFAATGTRGS